MDTLNSQQGVLRLLSCDNHNSAIIAGVARLCGPPVSWCTFYTVLLFSILGWGLSTISFLFSFSSLGLARAIGWKGASGWFFFHFLFSLAESPSFSVVELLCICIRHSKFDWLIPFSITGPGSQGSCCCSCGLFDLVLYGVSSRICWAVLSRLSPCEAMPPSRGFPRYQLYEHDI